MEISVQRSDVIFRAFLCVINAVFVDFLIVFFLLVADFERYDSKSNKATHLGIHFRILICFLNKSIGVIA